MKRVIVIEDHTAIRQMMCQFIESLKEYEIVGETGDGQEAYRICLEKAPDLVVLDIMLPGLNGIEVLSRFIRHLTETRVLIFSGFKSEDLLQRSMSAGAHGFLEKSASLDDLKKAMRTVVDGGTYFGSDSKRILRLALKKTISPRSIDILTARERETLQLIAEGNSTRGIAEKLSISIKTAENHRTNLMRKLDRHNAAALTRYAMDMGMLKKVPSLEQQETELIESNSAPSTADSESPE